MGKIACAILLAVAALFAASGCASVPAVCERITQEVYRVQRVVDGDTLVVVYDGEPTRVRLLAPVSEGGDPPPPVEGYDEPELHAPGGEASADTLRRRVGGRMIRLAFPLDHRRDPWGRLLATACTAPGR
jgi:endonuclease YncB( thermonuclease family)